jgi:hypothetical protein
VAAPQPPAAVVLLDGWTENGSLRHHGYRLVSLDAKTGQPTPGFGKRTSTSGGVVYGNRQPINLETGEIGLHSTPTVTRRYRDRRHRRSASLTVKTHNNTKAGADVRTGAAVDVQHDSAASSATTRGRTTRGP